MATLTWEEKVGKAKETAAKKAEKDGLDEQATQDRGYIVKVKSNPAFCGIGAGGVQFANGEAHVTSERMAEWFREHNGYEVTKA